jgi:ribosome-associated heat shock protein Hsp15
MARKRRKQPANEPRSQAVQVSVRVDKWLWAARCFKTRTQSTDACSAGHLKLNDRAASASASVKVGDMVDIKTHGDRRVLKVIALGERRGSAEMAAKLFEDLTPPPPPQPVAQAQWSDGGGRADRRQRRDIRKNKGW